MRQVTTVISKSAIISISKLPVRQVTNDITSHCSFYFSKLPVRQVTRSVEVSVTTRLSKLPVRQVTLMVAIIAAKIISKLPVRQVTHWLNITSLSVISKLPVRQVTFIVLGQQIEKFSKLPVRQVTATSYIDAALDFSKLPVRQVTNRVSGFLQKNENPARHCIRKPFFAAIAAGLIKRAVCRPSEKRVSDGLGLFGVMPEAAPFVVAPFFTVYIEADDGVFLRCGGEGFGGVAGCFFGKGVGQALAKPRENGGGGAGGGGELESYFGIPAVFAAAVAFGVFTGFEGDFFVFGVPEGDVVGLGAAGAERADFGVVGGQRGGVAGLAV